MAENIVELLTDVADAIREKKGSTEPINAQNFAEEIRNIPSGGEAVLGGQIIDESGQGILNPLHIVVSDGVKEIVSRAYYQAGLVHIELPNTIDTIGISAFYQTQLSELNLPDAIDVVPNEIVQNCYQLVRVKLPNQAHTIGGYAFKNCTKLQELDIPNKMKTLLTQIANGCTSLKKIIVRATTPPTLGANAFANNASDRLIYVPDDSLDAYKSATNWSTYADAIRPLSELPNE